jgi:hypothetical protein
MRFSVAIAALTVLAPLGFGAGAAAAQPFQPFQGQSFLGGRPNTPKAPWCLNATTGFERVEEDCSFGSFAACQRALGNPNNGFCTQTSLYAGPPPVSPRKKKRKARRGPA